MDTHELFEGLVRIRFSPMSMRRKILLLQVVMLTSQTTKREPFTNPSWRPRGSELVDIEKNMASFMTFLFPNSLLDAGSASLPVCASRSGARIDDDDDDDDEDDDNDDDDNDDDDDDDDDDDEDDDGGGGGDDSDADIVKNTIILC